MKKWFCVVLAGMLLAGCMPFATYASEENVMTSLSDTQRNSVGVLNYLAYLTKEIESQKSNRLYLEDAYSSLYNNTYMNAIDEVTLGQVKSMLTALYNFKMIAAKRERLEYIYEQNQAQAIRNAIPDPLAVMNVIKSGSWQKMLVSVIFMAVDSVASYDSAKNAAEMEYLQNGWELEDEEAAVLHSGHLDSIEYMWEIIHDYDLPGDLAINEDDIDRFVTWKNNANLVGRIQFLESNQSVYQAFGEYWLVLAESYYDHGDLGKCLNAVNSYETYSTRIFRKDYHYAKVLPLAITAAGEVYPEDRYITEADRFASRILENCDQEDWATRYFAAETFVALAGLTSDAAYLQKAFDVTLDNVNILVQEQIANNKSYLAEVRLEKVPEGASESKKKEIDAYNKGLQEARKTAVPPVSAALVLNCDFLFSLADQLELDQEMRAKIDGILFGHDEALFLNPFMNGLYVLDETAGQNEKAIEITFDGKEIIVPAMYLTEGTTISAGGLDANIGKVFAIEDWTLKSVNRKNSADIGTYMATFTSKTAAGFEYSEGSTVWINLNPAGDEHTENRQISFTVVSQKDFLLSRLVFQRIGA